MSDHIAALSDAFDSLSLETFAVRLLIVVFAALAAGTLIRWWTHRRRDEPESHERLASLATWWVLVLLFGTAVGLGRTACLLLVAALSVLAWREWVSLVPSLRTSRWNVVCGCVGIGLNYACVYADRYDLVPPLIVAYVLLAVATSRLSGAVTRGFLGTTSAALFGMVLTGLFLSHAALLLAPFQSADPALSTASLGRFVLVVLLTQVNDIAQALWGRRFGRHRITPRVSPHKSWEGLIGGLATTTLLAVALLVWVEPWLDRSLLPDGPDWWRGVLGATLGVVVGLGGFAGDLLMSAVKRDVGVKDSGTLLPGQGGILDRVDSLILSAPLAFHFLRWLSG